MTMSLAGDLGAPVVALVTGVAATGVAAAATAWVRRGGTSLTPADAVTLTRVTLGTGVLVLAVLAVAGVFPPRTWSVVALAVPALLLDAVDGVVARRHGSSRHGRWLDPEADAALLLVLSVPAAMVVGWWALAIGAMRYLFALAGALRSSLRAPVVPALRGRLVGGLQGAALTAALAPVVPVPLATAVVVTALAALAWSFGCDIVRLERAGPTAPRPSSRRSR